MPPSRRPAHGAVRPRYGRILVALSSVAVTTTAVLGAAGALPGTVGDSAVAAPVTVGVEPQARLEPGVHPRPPAARDRREKLAGDRHEELSEDPEKVAEGSTDLPEDSGEGRRVVFDMSGQRVWLVGGAERVRRSYLVSGSVTDNLEPGTYEVYSRSRHAVGIDDSGTMEFMVRFARGNRAAIGFHDIPVKDGEPVQSRAELGTPRSHGCIRQWRPDARALWHFANVGTTVVVTD